MMVIMMMVVVLAGRHWRKRINQLHVASSRSIPLRQIVQRHPASGAEPVFARICASTRMARPPLLGFRHRPGRFRIHLQGNPLCRLERGLDLLLPGLRPAQVSLHPPKNVL